MPIKVNNFKDFSLTFKPHPITGDLQVTKDETAVKQSIRSLLLTVKSERLFNFELGTRLKEVLFEPLDFASASLVKNEITEVITRFEPRVTIVRLDVFPDQAENGYEVELEYIISGREKRIKTELFLEALS